MSTRLRNKLLFGALAIIVFVVGLSTVATSLMISAQSQQAAHEALRRAMKVIEDDLASMASDLLVDSQQIATSPDMGENIRFLSEEKSAAGLRDFLGTTYRDVAAKVYAICQTGGVWRASVYDTDGDLTSFVTIDSHGAMLAYPLAQRFVVVSVKPGEELQDELWQERDDLTGVEHHDGGEVPPEATTRYETVEGVVCLVTCVPVMGNVFNTKAKVYESKQVGWIRAVRRIGDEFVSRTGRLTGMRINVYGRGELTAGEVFEYTHLDLDALSRSGDTEPQEASGLILSERALEGQDFHEGILPLVGPAGRAGSVVALYSKEIAKANTRQTIRVLSLLSVACILLVVPVAFMFSKTLTGPIEAMVRSAKVIAGGDYDAEIPLSERKDEIGSLSRSFARMRDAIHNHIADLAELNRTLEGRVKERTAQLRQSEEEFRNLYETSLVGLWRTRISDGKFINANGTTASLLGYATADELVECVAASEHYPKERRAELIRLLTEHGHVSDFELHLTDDRGTERDVSVSATMYAAKGYLEGAIIDISERKRAEAELATAHKELLEVSRKAGMSEIATGVLHNVGNVLNSVNVSAGLLAEQVRKSEVTQLKRASDLVAEHVDDMATFVAEHPQGKHLPDFLIQLSQHLAGEQERMLDSVGALQDSVEHVKEIVATQQAYANVSGVTETVSPKDLIEDALRMEATSLAWDTIEVNREYEDVPDISVERHKLIQILINLLSNATEAMAGLERDAGHLTLRIKANGDDRVQIDVIDDGVGIPAEDAARIFNYGFTTKENGHGFGLHNSANAANELGGSLTAHSDGAGRGARFTLDVPLRKSGAMGHDG